MTRRPARLAAIAAAVCASSLSAAAAQPRALRAVRAFTPGNILAVLTNISSDRDDGTLDLTLQEINPTSLAIVQSISLPSVDGPAGYGLRLSNSLVEGALVRTDDGCSVLLSGYGASSLGSPPADPQNDPTAPRVVAVISPSGAIDITTRSFTYAWQVGFMPAEAGDCGRLGPDPGANPRDALQLPDGRIILTGKSGVQLPMTPGLDYNVSRFSPSGPFDALFVSLYNRNSCNGPNVRAAYLYRGQLLVASSGSTGPYRGVTVFPGALTVPSNLTEWPRATLPTAAYRGSSTGPNGVVQVDEGTIYSSDPDFGIVSWRRNATGGWSVVSVDNYGPNGTSLGTNKVSMENSAGGAPRIYATSLRGGGAVDTTIYEFLPTGTGPARFRAVLTSAPGMAYRSVAGVPFCRPLSSVSASQSAPALPSPTSALTPSSPPAGGGGGGDGVSSAAVLGGSIGGGLAVLGIAVLGAALVLAGRGASATFSGPARAEAHETRGTRVHHMQRALAVGSARLVEEPAALNPLGAAAPAGGAAPSGGSKSDGV